MISKTEDKVILLEELDPISMHKHEIEKYYGKPDIEKEQEWIYFLSSRRLFSKRLHIYFTEDRVIDYFIHHYFMGVYIV